MEPRSEVLDLPAGYRRGAPKKTLSWAEVRERLTTSRSYWLASVRPDGRPHVVPVDGLWTGGALYFGGSAETVHERNLRRDGRVAVHLADTVAAVIVEGRAERITPTPADARRLAAASKEKYGYDFGPEVYQAGCWALHPTRVIAWNSIADDATRFRFDIE